MILVLPIFYFMKNKSKKMKEIGKYENNNYLVKMKIINY